MPRQERRLRHLHQQPCRDLPLKGDFETAEALFKEALEIYEDDLGTDHFVYLSALNNLGLVYQDLKRYDGSRGAAPAGAAPRSAEGGKRERRFATTLNNLASVAMATGTATRRRAGLSGGDPGAL